jgi:hypothetical protein
MLLTSELAPKSLFWIFFRSAAEMRSNQHTIFTPFGVQVGPWGDSINCEKKEGATEDLAEWRTFNELANN